MGGSSSYGAEVVMRGFVIWGGGSYGAGSYARVLAIWAEVVMGRRWLRAGS